MTTADAPEQPGVGVRRLSREQRLLIASARTSLDADRARIVNDLAGSELDWELVMRSADAHGVLPLLELQLRQHASDVVPPEVLAELRRHGALVAANNLELAAALVIACDALREAGVMPLTYKGPVLAEAVYGNLALRQFVDVDVLVRRNDILRARTALEGLGYRSELRFSPAHERRFIELSDEFAMVDASTELTVDLQWAIAPRTFALDLDMEGLWARCETARVGGREVSTPSAEDLLLMLCIHGSKHRWRRILWISDVAELTRARPDLDWDAVLRRATAVGGLRMLCLGLYLSRRLLGAEIPSEVWQRVRSDNVMPRLAGTIIRDRLGGVAAPEHEGEHDELSFDPLDLRMRERARDKSRYVVRHLFGPTKEDWDAFSLPDWSAFGYSLIRPFRLAGRYARRGFFGSRSSGGGDAGARRSVRGR